jgi:Xaa-Pro aminopeptidase
MALLKTLTAKGYGTVYHCILQIGENQEYPFGSANDKQTVAADVFLLTYSMEQSPS